MRVFVSSTCHDLVDVRAELEAHLRDMGLVPLLSDRPSSEFEVQPAANSIETCLAGVRSADVFICLLSQRYGPSLKGVGYADVSATHLEWQEARQQGKAIRMYVRDRLEAEYAIWRRNPASPLAWVRDPKDHGIFAFLEDHRKLVAGASSSNWLWTFRDSVDLKARVANDLRYVSTRAVLERWLTEGRLPTVQGSVRQRHGGLPGEEASFTVGFAVYGAAPALACSCNGQALGDIAPGQNATVVLRCITPNGPLHTQEIAIEYATNFGATIEDTFLLSYNTGQAELGSVALKRKRLLKAMAIALE